MNPFNQSTRRKGEVPLENNIKEKRVFKQKTNGYVSLKSGRIASFGFGKCDTLKRCSFLLQQDKVKEIIKEKQKSARKKKVEEKRTAGNKTALDRFKKTSKA